MEGLGGAESVVDYPDGTLPIVIYLHANLLSQLRNLPWWIRHSPKRILFLDDFEGVFKWVVMSPLGTVERVNAVFEGNYALGITSPASKGQYAVAEIKLGASSLSKFALQLRWSPHATGDEVFKDIYVQVGILGVDYDRYATIRYLHHETDFLRKWQYFNENGVMADIPNATENIYALGYRTHYLYFAFDMNPEVFEFKRLVTDTLDLDLSGLSLYKEAAIGQPGIVIDIGVSPDSDNLAYALIDTLCLSDQEE